MSVYAATAPARQVWPGWSPTVEQTHLTLLTAGLTYTQVAESLGCSRNVALGEGHRLGLRGVQPPVPEVERVRKPIERRRASSRLVTHHYGLPLFCRTRP